MESESLKSEREIRLERECSLLRDELAAARAARWAAESELVNELETTRKRVAALELALGAALCFSAAMVEAHPESIEGAFKVLEKNDPRFLAVFPRIMSLVGEGIARAETEEEGGS